MSDSQTPVANAAAPIEATNQEADGTEQTEGTEVAEPVAEVERLVRKYSLDVNGKKVDTEIDFDNEEQVKALLQKGYAADQRFREAAQLRKQVEHLVTGLQKDPLNSLAELGIKMEDLPIESLEKLGVNVDSMVQKYINQKIEEMEKSPEQKEKEDMMRKFEAERAAKESYEKRFQAMEDQKLLAEAEVQIQEEIIDALKGSELLKDGDPRDIRTIASYMQLGYSATESVQFMEQDYIASWQNKFQKMAKDNPAQLEKFLGKEHLEGLRQKRITNATLTKKKGPPAKPVETGTSSRTNKTPKDDKMSVDDFFRKLGR